MPRLLVTGLSLWRSWFDSRLVHARFVVDKATLGQVSFRIGFDSTNAAHSLYLQVALTGRTSGRGMRVFKNQSSFGSRGTSVKDVFTSCERLKVGEGNFCYTVLRS
jgi:hypothetical protein